MEIVIKLANRAQTLLDRLVDTSGFLAPLLLRLYLAPVFWMAGTKKLGAMEDTIAWFGNPDWGLGLPFPALLAWLATLTEAVGAVLLALGLGVRWISIPLIVTMIVAAVTVHLQNGWLAIAESSGVFSTERTVGAIERLERAKEILKQYGDYNWLTENGSIVILNNGIEFAMTYMIMLMALFVTGGGKFVSIDYWIKRKYGTN